MGLIRGIIGYRFSQGEVNELYSNRVSATEAYSNDFLRLHEKAKSEGAKETQALIEKYIVESISILESGRREDIRRTMGMGIGKKATIDLDDRVNAQIQKLREAIHFNP